MRKQKARAREQIRVTRFASADEQDIDLTSVWRIKPSLWASYYYISLIVTWVSLCVAGYVNHVFSLGLMAACFAGLPLCVLLEFPHWRDTQASRILSVVDNNWQLESRLAAGDAITTPMAYERDSGQIDVLLTTPFCLRLKIVKPFYIWRDQLTATEWRSLRSHCAVERALAFLPDGRGISQKDE